MITFDYIIEDHCLGMIDDYKITNLWEKSHDAETGAEIPGDWLDRYHNYLDGFLYIAISRFKSYCDHLEYDKTTRAFINELTELEVEILAWYWIVVWARREVNNSSQISLKLKVNTSFTFSSEGQTHKAKMQWIDSLEEEGARKITQYQLLNSNW